ncbi:hypothetical protein PHYBLDRAFT_169308 [Phycomyces blakesleeanus NRRL 1555(-)]|uniref:Transmembrane protein n=1 Tax=Phycomyces blakesleeanus (strain ATCC 8743b / DSM 1359 / FGSC 10004 / NBRC 33097 / NRRL 1555) TaxID=763407 RepID=A0A163AF35_PHYB8|nr:hypothetical protein PHYBLDRAFT_169308 [Phycomyces blakesleeanus NRRL 1555(-)]OAD73051.1 hypothetical protein PHYBLDRAFT_169308 [Phycomyces blakesleeanus NRRL 1555(-)]|eukprot:XP_018291091.1 hypothetical protein PHYBLDRAFT_169308 [Phycomyces blakesleeanus NRRL 1555(-)]
MPKYDLLSQEEGEDRSFFLLLLLYNICAISLSFDRSMISTIVSVLETWALRQKGDEVLLATWYPDLKYHAVELTFIPVLMFMLLIYSAWKLVRSKTSYESLLLAFDPPKETSLEEKISLGILIGSWTMTFVQRWIKSDLLHLLLPCFMSQILLIIVILYPNKRSVIPTMLFNIYLYTQWGGLAALLFPDLRDHILPGETINFVIEHLIILIAPLFLIKSGRYLILPSSRDVYMFSFAIYIMYNCPFVQCLGLFLDINLNYLQVPPPAPIIEIMGPYYRPALYVIAAINMYITRYILVDGVIPLLQKDSILRTKKAE